MPIVRHDCPRKDSPGYKYQTEKYGVGFVVANKIKGGDNLYRCTICGAEIHVQGTSTKKKKKKG